jgi:hypothetical protein
MAQETVTEVSEARLHLLLLPRELRDLIIHELRLENALTSLARACKQLRYEIQSRFLDLPQALRNQVITQVGRCCDLTPLARTCRRLRFEVFQLLPGRQIVSRGGSSIDCWRAKSDFRWSVHIDHLHIIAEPWLSPAACLRFRVKWRYTAMASYGRRHKGLQCGPFISDWVISDLTSTMARPIYWLRYPEKMTISFITPRHMNWLAAIFILRAKLIDICQVMHIMAKSHRHGITMWGGIACFKIHFREAFDRRRCTSFWHHRFPVSASGDKDLRLYFYESIMLPLFACHPFYPNALAFDFEPRRRQSNFHSTHCSWPLRRRYHGVRELFDTLVYSWLDSRRKNRPARWDDFDNVLNCLEDLYRHSGQYLAQTGGPQAAELAAHLLHRRSALRGSHNPFSGCIWALPSAPNSSQGDEDRRPRRCNAEDNAEVRQYLLWARDWFLQSEPLGRMSSQAQHLLVTDPALDDAMDASSDE